MGIDVYECSLSSTNPIYEPTGAPIISVWLSHITCLHHLSRFDSIWRRSVCNHHKCPQIDKNAMIEAAKQMLTITLNGACFVSVHNSYFFNKWLCTGSYEFVYYYELVVRGFISCIIPFSGSRFSLEIS